MGIPDLTDFDDFPQYLMATLRFEFIVKGYLSRAYAHFLHCLIQSTLDIATPTVAENSFQLSNRSEYENKIM